MFPAPRHLRRRTRPRLPLLLALAASLAGCAVPGAGHGGPAGVTPRGIAVAVDNTHHLDMRVYLMRGASRVLLGRVGSFARRTFVVDAARLGGSGSVRLAVDPAGSRPLHAFPALTVERGQRVELRVGHELRYSSLAVR